MSEGRLMAHLDGELAAEREREVAAHLERCASCRDRREELRRASGLLARALPALDVAAPEREAARVRQIARERGGSATAEARGHGRGARWSLAGRGLLLKAALVVLAVGTAAAAVVPGSPLREWIAGAVGPSSPGPYAGAAVRERAPPGPESVSIPVDERAVVQILDPAPGLVLRVRPTDEARLTVTGRADRWETGPGSVEANGPGGAELVVELPRGLASVRISVDDRLLLERERGRVRLHAPADTAGDSLLFRVGRRDRGS